MSTKRTCLPYKQRHYCVDHKKFLDSNHLAEFSHLQHSKACMRFSDFLKTTPLEMFNNQLIKGIIKSFELLNNKIKNKVTSGELRVVNLILRHHKTQGIIRKDADSQWNKHINDMKQKSNTLCD